MKKVIIIALFISLNITSSIMAEDKIITPELHRSVTALVEAWKHNNKHLYALSLDRFIEIESQLLLLGEQNKDSSYLRNVPNKIVHSREAIAPWIWIMMMKKKNIDLHPATMFNGKEYLFSSNYP